MKIIYIGKYPWWDRRSYGGEKQFQTIAESFGKKGNEVYFVNSTYNGNTEDIIFKRLEYRYIPVFNRLDGNQFPLYPIFSGLKRLIDEINPDIIHHFARFGLSTEHLRNKYQLQIPTVNLAVSSRTKQDRFTLLKLLAYGKINSALTSYFERFITRNSDVVIVPSTAIKDILIREFNVDSRKIEIIPHGISINKTHDNYCSWDRVQKNLIFFAGRLEDDKGVNHVINSMRHILRHIPDAKLMIAGDGKKLENYKTMAKKIDPYAIIFLGKLNRDEMNEMYSKCNVFVMHSKFESFGLVTGEAMSFARPVVASNTGGTSDIIKNNKTGFLEEFGDVVGIAGAITEILSNDEQAKIMGECGRRRIEEVYTPENEINKIEEVYRKLV